MMIYCENCGKPMTSYEEGVVLGFVPLEMVCNFCYRHYWFRKSEEWLELDEGERKLIEYLQKEDDGYD